MGSRYRSWFLVSFYYFGIYLLKPSLAHFKRFIWLYVLAFSIVIAYTFNVHAGYAFSQETANWVMSPFYNDHTSYGAMLAMFLPPMIILITLRNETLATRVAAYRPIPIHIYRRPILDVQFFVNAHEFDGFARF